jgi:hypothetical protein
VVPHGWDGPLLFRAATEDVVRSTGQRCDVPFDRIVEPWTSGSIGDESSDVPGDLSTAFA